MGGKALCYSSVHDCYRYASYVRDWDCHWASIPVQENHGEVLGSHHHYRYHYRRHFHDDGMVCWDSCSCDDKEEDLVVPDSSMMLDSRGLRRNSSAETASVALDCFLDTCWASFVHEGGEQDAAAADNC